MHLSHGAKRRGMTYAELGVEDVRALLDGASDLLAALPDDLGEVGRLRVAGVILG